MKVKELAKAFGMSVEQIVSISGYSKQGLYDVLERKRNINSNRFNSFLDHLQFISHSIHEQDIAEARIQLNNRAKILEQLKEQKNE